MTAVIGIDFGTTNSVVTVLGPDGATATARYQAGDVLLDVFRTVLCFWTDAHKAGAALRHAAGPDAIESYLDDPLDSRLIMSMKTYLAQRSFTETRIFGRPFTLERLVALFLGDLLHRAGATAKGARIVAGRPVRFAGEFADDTLGEQRLRASYAAAGMPEIEVALEPEAAGYRFARRLTRDATVLVGDFGGGTSDFSLMRFQPGSNRRVVPLGHAGIGIAGDNFDFRIIDRVISPLLGKGDVYKVMGKELPVPPEYFSSFARWHRMSLMRNPAHLARDRRGGAGQRPSGTPGQSHSPDRGRAGLSPVSDGLRREGRLVARGDRDAAFPPRNARYRADHHPRRFRILDRRGHRPDGGHGRSRFGGFRMWRWRTWTMSSSPAAPPSCPPSAACSMSGSARTRSRPAANSSRYPKVWR